MDTPLPSDLHLKIAATIHDKYFRDPSVKTLESFMDFCEQAARDCPGVHPKTIASFGAFCRDIMQGIISPEIKDKDALRIGYVAQALAYRSE